ncbi:MAG TPA: membrane protein insertase YidC, partial [Candidatus Eisenbacteria bacterium]|nr:membrane protein insertase YidC [Candidatus Eisenbacteria bacterium]
MAPSTSGTAATGTVPSAVSGSTTPGLTAATQPQTGAPGTRPSLPSVPVVRREIRNEHFRAVFTSEGGAIESWILPRYPDLAHGDEVPVNLVAPGERAMNVAVTTSHFDWDYRGEPFRLDEARSSDSSVTFVAEDMGGVRVTKSYRIAPDPRALDVEIRIEVPAPYGAIQYRWGWWNALPQIERKPNPKERQAVALVGDKLETYDFEKLAKSGSKEVTGTVRWAGNRSKYFVAVLLPDSATVSSAYFTAASGATPDTKGQPTVTLNGAAPPGTQIVRRARLYAGPIHYETLVAQGAELDRLANLGWRWLMGLSALLLWSLNALHKVIPNYGIAII